MDLSPDDIRLCRSCVMEKVKRYRVVARPSEDPVMIELIDLLAILDELV